MPNKFKFLWQQKKNAPQNADNRESINVNLTLNLSPDLIHLLKLFLTPSVNSASDADRSSSPAPDVSSKSRSPLTPHRSPLFPCITNAASDAGKAESVEADHRSK